MVLQSILTQSLQQKTKLRHELSLHRQPKDIPLEAEEQQISGARISLISNEVLFPKARYQIIHLRFEHSLTLELIAQV